MSSVNLAVLKRRIKSVESTMKITKAMSMVANSKYSKCKGMLYKNNKFLKEVLKNIGRITDVEELSRYYDDRDKGKKVMIVFTSDSGLCGGFNSSIAKAISREDYKDMEFIVCGSKGRDFLHGMGAETIAEYVEIPYYSDIKESRVIANKVFSEIEREKCEVYVMYYRYINSIKRELINKKIFPFDSSEAKFDTESNKNKVEDVISFYLNSVILNCILESKVSELSFRIETTNSAIKNGKEILKDLKKMYNRIRQSNITNELSEIVGGVEALNKG